jgi:hypothetical protein
MQPEGYGAICVPLGIEERETSSYINLECHKGWRPVLPRVTEQMGGAHLWLSLRALGFLPCGEGRGQDLVCGF